MNTLACKYSDEHEDLQSVGDGSSCAKAMPREVALLSAASTVFVLEKAHLGIHAVSVFFDSFLTSGTQLL